ncbi:MAG: hypothetical protein ACK5NT_02245 [Pyrinomonadaceae bacterium]
MRRRLASLVFATSQTAGNLNLHIHSSRLEREYIIEKWCADTTPFQNVHQVGHLDAWRRLQFSLSIYNQKNVKGIKKETFAKVLSAEKISQIKWAFHE